MSTTQAAAGTGPTAEPGTAPPASGSPVDEQEIRIALVMTGGVSLAVWMGGVAAELYRAIVRDESYKDLLQLLRSRVRVDIVSGSSAGGLNGVLMSQALARSLPVAEVDRIREVWLDSGAMTSLLRSPFQADPPSLLQGDEYFLRRIETVLTAWKDRGPATWHHVGQRFDLVVTATLLQPEYRRFRDDLDEVIVEDDHRGHLYFTKEHLTKDAVVPILARAARTSASFPGAFEASYWSRDMKIDGLAPIADFTPGCFAIDGGVLANLPVRPALEKLYGRSSDHDMRRVLAYVSPDPGGPPSGPPAPPGVSGGVPETPSLGAVVAASFTLPSKQSIAQDLADLRDYNQRIIAQVERRASLLALTDSATIVTMAGNVYDLFKSEHQRRSVDYTLAGVLSHAPDVIDRIGQDRWKALIDQLADVRGSWLPDAFPDEGHTLELIGESASPWEWGIAPLEYSVSVALDIVRRAFALVALEHTEQLQQLGALRAAIHDVRGFIDRVRALDDHYWNARFADFPAAAPEPAVRGAAPTVGGAKPDDVRFPEVLPAATAADNELAHWATTAYAAWPGAPDATDPVVARVLEIVDAVQRRVSTVSVEIEPSGVPALADPVAQWQFTVRRLLEAIAIDLAQVLLEWRDTLRTVAEQAPDTASERPGEAGQARGAVYLRIVDGLLSVGATAGAETEAAGATDAAPLPLVVQRLLALYVLQATSCDDTEFREQPIDFVQFSANVKCDLDLGRATAADKLTGLQLHHFGAFFKESWRANDWMWGRLDGAAKLIQVILQPDRFARVMQAPAAGGDGPGAATPRRRGYLAVMRLALGTGGDPAPPNVLIDRWRTVFSAPVWEELAYLDDPTRPVPSSLPWCSRAIAFRRHVDIAAVELPAVGDAVERSSTDGGATSGAAKSFARKAGAQRPVPPDDVPELMLACKVGAETLHDEIGYDLFTRTTSTALAVTTNALRGKHSPLGPLRHLFQSARAAVLSVWLLAQSSVKASRTGFALTALLLAFGTGTIAVAILGAGVPQALLVAAVVALAAWFVSTAMITRASAFALMPIAVALLLVGVTQIDKKNAILVFTDANPARNGWKHWLDSYGDTVAYVVIGIAFAVLALRVVDRLRAGAKHGLSAGVRAREITIGLVGAAVAVVVSLEIGSIRRWVIHGQNNGTRGHFIDVLGSLHAYRAVVLLFVLPAAFILVEVIRRGVVDRARKIFAHG